MRVPVWIMGLVLMFGGAGLYAINYPFGIEAVISIGVVGAVWSLLFWMSTVVDRIVDPQKGDSRGIFTALLSIAFSLMGLVFVVAVHTQWKDKNLGTFGDFLGGVLNPILTFLSFMALLFTIILQQREIHSAKKDATDLQKEKLEQRLSEERRQFENTFFQMLAIHNTIVNSMDVDRGKTKNKLHGRECFKHFRDLMLDAYKRASQDDELKRSIAAHDAVWVLYQNDLAHYYRYLYNIIRFINESDVKKIRYIRILRAQLSDFELLVLFYNGLFPLAKKFKEYVEFFTLFNNLPKDLLFDRSHEDFYAASAFDETVPKEPLSFSDA